MDRTDIEIEEYEEIIGDLGRNADQGETEEARAVSIQEFTPSDPGNLMTHTERVTLRPVYKSPAGNTKKSRIRWSSHTTGSNIIVSKLRKSDPSYVD